MKILEITKKLDMEKYYYENMVYDRSFDSEKKRILNSHTKAELTHMFKVLYNVSRVYGDKEHIFDEIQRYFDNIERALHLWKAEKEKSN